MEILEIHRGHVKVRVGRKIATIYGEALLRIENSDNPDFVLYSNSIKCWDPPDEAEEINEERKNKILKFLKKEFVKRKMRLEIE